MSAWDYRTWSYVAHDLTHALRQWYARRRFSTHHRMRIYSKLSRKVEAGRDTDKALGQMLRTVTRDNTRFRHPQVQPLQVWHRITKTRPLADAMKGWAPPLERALVGVGESTASRDHGSSLPSCLRDIVWIEKSRQRIMRATKRALLSPLLSTATLLGLLIFFSFSIVPNALEQLKDGEVVGSGLVLANVCAFVRNWGWLVALSVVATTLFYYWSRHRLTGRLRKWADKHLLPYQLFRTLSGTGFLFSVAALLAAGQDEADALSLLRSYASPYEAERIDATLRHVKGVHIGPALLKAGYEYPDLELIYDLIDLKDDADPALEIRRIAQDWLETLVERMEDLTETLNTVCLVALGFAAAGMLGGYYDLIRQVNQTWR